MPFITRDFHVPMNDDDVRRLVEHAMAAGAGAGGGASAPQRVDAVMARYPFPATPQDAAAARGLPAVFVDGNSGRSKSGGGGGGGGGGDGGGFVEWLWRLLGRDGGGGGDGATDSRPPRYRTQVGRISAIITDQMFTCAARRMAAALTAAGEPRAWLYQFNFNVPGHQVLGTYHSSDLSFVFRSFDALDTLEQRVSGGLLPVPRVERMSNVILRYWRGMAAAGDPNVVTPGGAPGAPGGQGAQGAQGALGPQEAQGVRGDQGGNDAADMWPWWGGSVGGGGPVPGGVSLDLDLPAALVGGLQKNLCDFWDELAGTRTAPV